MTDKLKKAKYLRNCCLNEINSFNNIAKQAKIDKSQMSMLKVRYSDLESIKDDFEKHHQQIISLLLVDPDANMLDEETIYEGFRSEYYSIKAIYYDLFEKNSGDNSNRNSVSIRENNSKVRLPNIDLPKFDGDFTTFATFIDLFNCLVHENDQLNNVEKFNYLITSLQGAPLALVRRFPLTADNYLSAYEKLLERYCNTRLRAQAHWSQLDNAPKLSSHNLHAIRKLVDTYTENIDALKNLGFAVEDWDFILVMMILKRLDEETNQKFELEHGSKEIPTFENLISFLNKICIAIDTLSFSNKVVFRKVFSSANASKPNISKNSFFAKPSFNKCILCNENHFLYNCDTFINKTPNERYIFCKKSHLCLNCLSNIHEVKSCKSLSSCRFCQKKHHSLLHFDKPVTAVLQENVQPSTSVSDDIQTKSVSLLGSGTSIQNVLLSTAIVEARSYHGTYYSLRSLLDSGSMVSFITLKTAKLLKLKVLNNLMEVNGLGASTPISPLGEVSFIIRPVGKLQPEFCVEAIVLEKICDKLPITHINPRNWTHLANLKLADSSFDIPGNIDILLGADIFTQVLLDERVLGVTGAPDALNTVFGYILLGKIENTVHAPLSSLFCSCALELSVDNALKKFWEIENIPTKNFCSPEDKLAEEIFKSTIRRDNTGRFIVTLPFIDTNSLPTFPNSKSLALNRFYSLERRLLKQPQLYADYSQFMQQYLDLNHMEPVETCGNDSCYYIPHLYVIKPDSETTKLRVVFNASAKFSGQTSLNDHLLTGPKLQLEICTILINFRCLKYVLCADVKQMYRMILVSPEHRDFQRILWRFSPNESVQDFRLRTVTYGVKSSPYLAIRSLIQLAKENGEKFSSAADAIRNDVYVDDILTGNSSLSDAKDLRDQLIHLFQLGGFELHKWCSNEISLIYDLPQTQISQNFVNFEEDEQISSLKILGLFWNPKNDCFSFSVKTSDKSYTKRNILSDIARIYDPLGFLSPVTFFAKHLMQRLWTSGIDWDQSLSDEITQIWCKFKSELNLLSSLVIPRFVLPNYSLKFELHGFGDASLKGYACAVYLKVIDNNGEIFVNLICAKSKVAPLKCISIPRLELSAAVLVSDLLSYCANIFDRHIIIEKMFAWSDSRVVLAWIKSPPYKWKTFVANRVSQIQEKVPPHSWYYIDSKRNPADCACRGTVPSEFISNKSWFSGPEFLYQHDTFCLEPDLLNDHQAFLLEEERKSVFLSTSRSVHTIDELLENYSSFSKLQRVIAYILRFIQNCKSSSNKINTPLTTMDLYNALIILVKRTQQIHFAEEFGKKVLSKPFRKLNAFLDEKGIYRVGGRLSYSALSYDYKHPILLPRLSRLTYLLIQFYHRKYLHAGLRTTHFLLSQHFWILSPKRAIRSVLSKCLQCWKTQPKAFQPQMGNLPVSRISEVKPFLHTGVDFAGPFTITMHRHRGAKSLKVYICIFVCFAVKAVHIEVASDLSTPTFLAALQRFIARRGRCEHLYSDCGTNFKGAYKQLKDFMKQAAQSETIEWHFNPPTGSHFGGLWESAVKSVKTHLRRVIGQQILTYEEFTTILTMIESVLNSRPLTSISSDPNDPVSALTPGHFLTLAPLSSIPVPDFNDIPINKLSRWQMLQRMHSDFWTRYKGEYLHTLQQRTKWYNPSIPIEINSLVLIKNENTSPLQWPLGRIKSITAGADGVSRVAVLQTANGLYTRPIVKLCPLPIS